MDRTLWTLDDANSRDAFERVVLQLGGHELADHRERARQALARLAARLDPALRPLYLEAQDAASDAAAAREDAAIQAALWLGAGLGAALAAHPAQPPEPLLLTVSPALLAALGSPLDLADATQAMKAALDGMRRLRVACSG